MSVDLGNSSHYDFNDASQGYSLWGEEIPGKGTNWYLVMPNIHGRRPGAKGTWIPFAGLAILITNGVSITWDGRDIRHCTLVSEPDGPPVEGAAGDWAGSVRQTENHLYGTFTAAKERVVEVGRKMSAAMGLWLVLKAPILQLLPLLVVTWKSQACQRQVPRRGGDDRKIERGRGGGVLVLLLTLLTMMTIMTIMMMMMMMMIMMMVVVWCHG